MDIASPTVLLIAAASRPQQSLGRRSGHPDHAIAPYGLTDSRFITLYRRHMAAWCKDQFTGSTTVTAS